MVHRLLLMTAVLFILGLSPVVGQEPGTSSPAEAGDPAFSPLAQARDSLRAAELAFAASVERKDLDAFAFFVTEEAVFLGAGVLRGKAAILAAWGGFFVEEAPLLAWEPEIAEVRGSGDLGITRGPYTLTRVNEEGETVVDRGSFMSIWQRQADGSWKIVFDSGCPPCGD